MENYSQDELKEALRAMNSMISKCEKVQVKMIPGTSQHTLLRNRLNALRISASLISDRIEED